MIPLNKNVLIEPVIEPSPWSTNQVTYAERGIVLEIGADVSKSFAIKVGDTVHFDGHTASFRKLDGKDVCLVACDRIRAKD